MIRKQTIQLNTIVRKLRILNNIQDLRVKYDNISEKLELTDKNRNFNLKKLSSLKLELQNTNATTLVNKPIPKDSCCGKGCNGCLIFWNSPKYSKARELLATKKYGQMLSKKEVSYSVEQ